MGLSESSIKSLNLLVRLQMAESGTTGMFWFRALVSSRDARNVTYHERIKMTQHMLVYGKPKNLSSIHDSEQGPTGTRKDIPKSGGRHDA